MPRDMRQSRLNPRAIDEGESGARAERRKYVIDAATEASTGEAGQAEGDRAKKALETKDGS